MPVSWESRRRGGAFSAGLGAVQQAIKIDESMTEAHALLGMFRKELGDDWTGARAAMARAWN
jgi:hypothetical protein